MNSHEIKYMKGVPEPARQLIDGMQQQIDTLTAMCETLNKLHETAVDMLKPAIEAAVLKEREACAKVLDEMAEQMVADMEPSTAIAYVRSKAATIRARSNT